MLMNSQTARKLAVSSSSVLNVTTMQRINANHYLEIKNPPAKPLYAKNALKKKSLCAKNTSAIPPHAAREQNFFVMQKQIAKISKLAMLKKQLTALKENIADNTLFLQNVLHASLISVDPNKENATRKTLENVLKSG